MAADSPCAMIIFGASGDLTRRKLIPALYNLECEGLLNRHMEIIGFARSRKDNDQFRNEMRDAVEKKSPHGLLEDKWKQFSARLHYISGRYDDSESFDRLSNLLAGTDSACGGRRYIFYLALPHGAVKEVLMQLNGNNIILPKGTHGSSRVMIEKPFGRDLASAQELNRLLSEMFDESQIYRIDHYIAKDTVRNILVFRFTNTIFEPLWNHEYIDNIRIIAAEDIGIEGRGGYYEQAGVVRDMVQNHVLQVLALVAMEPPSAGDAESVRDRKVEVFKSLEPIKKDDFILGQYDGYREEPNVDPNSCTPTYVAAKLFINNPRWKGVPFHIRSGKCLAKKVTEVIIQFKKVPVCVLDSEEACRNVQPNILTIRIQPDEGIHLRFCAKVPGKNDEISTANLNFQYSDLGKQLPDAYEQVLLDCMIGKTTLFWRSDGIEAAWQFVTPLLEAEKQCSLQSYKPGTWGPE